MGSNQGNRITALHQAVKLLGENGITICKQSLIYETPALMPDAAPANWNVPFLNMVVIAESALEPQDILAICKKIERELGRVEAERWAPRIIDLDLILYDSLTICSATLTVPHAAMHQRGFVLLPLAELMPDWVYPNLPWAPQHVAVQKTIRELAHSVFDQTETPLFLKVLPSQSSLVGILNTTPDSFSDANHSRMSSDYDWGQAYLNLFNSGAEVIDIGAESTRPGATPLTSETEQARLKPVLDQIFALRKSSAIYPLLSFDSYHQETVKWLITRYQPDWINDVSCGRNPELIRLLVGTSTKIVLMHSLTIPADKKIQLRLDQPAINAIKESLAAACDQALSIGLNSEQIILDPGIGFGKSSFHSLELLRKIDSIKSLGYKTLVGASRKSYINLLTNVAQAKQRDPETAGICSALNGKTNYLRVHDVELCARVMTAAELHSNKI